MVFYSVIVPDTWGFLNSYPRALETLLSIIFSLQYSLFHLSGTLRSSNLLTFLLQIAIISNKLLFCFLGYFLHSTIQTSQLGFLNSKHRILNAQELSHDLPCSFLVQLLSSVKVLVFTLQGFYGELLSQVGLGFFFCLYFFQVLFCSAHCL